MLEVVAGLGAVAAIGVVAQRARTYGGLGPSISGEMKAERAQLSAARREVKQRLAATTSELAAARKTVAVAEAAYAGRIQAAQAALTALTEPGSGSRVLSVGTVQLFEHLLVVNGEQHPLEGLTASVQLTQGCALLSIRFASGHVALQRFDTTERAQGSPTYTTRAEGDFDVLESSQRMVRAFSEAQIVGLSAAINNQVLWRRAFLTDAPALVPGARHALQLALADTAERDAAAAQLVALEQGSTSKQALESAQAALVQVQQRYDIAVADRRHRRQAPSVGADAPVGPIGVIGSAGPVMPARPIGSQAHRSGAGGVVARVVMFALFASGAAALLLAPLVDIRVTKISAYTAYQRGLADKATVFLIGSGACAAAALLVVVFGVARMARSATPGGPPQLNTAPRSTANVVPAMRPSSVPNTAPAASWAPPTR